MKASAQFIAIMTITMLPMTTFTFVSTSMSPSKLVMSRTAMACRAKEASYGNSVATPTWEESNCGAARPPRRWHLRVWLHTCFLLCLLTESTVAPRRGVDSGLPG